MQIGQHVITKKDGKVIQCFILEKQDDKLILSHEGEEISRKYWEVQAIRE